MRRTLNVQQLLSTAFHPQCAVVPVANSPVVGQLAGESLALPDSLDVLRSGHEVCENFFAVFWVRPASVVKHSGLLRVSQSAVCL